MEQRKNYFKKLNLGLIRLINSLGAIVEDVRTVFEKNNKDSIYILKF